MENNEAMKDLPTYTMKIDKSENTGVQRINIEFETEEEKLFNFFMWFRENGEKHVDKSIEKMIQFYLNEKYE
jgi:hypothetical protein